jgi:hypothetical protein
MHKICGCHEIVIHIDINDREFYIYVRIGINVYLQYN